jgi:hypothetical protein
MEGQRIQDLKMGKILKILKMERARNTQHIINLSDYYEQLYLSRCLPSCVWIFKSFLHFTYL